MSVWPLRIAFRYPLGSCTISPSCLIRAHSLPPFQIVRNRMLDDGVVGPQMGHGECVAGIHNLLLVFTMRRVHLKPPPDRTAKLSGGYSLGHLLCSPAKGEPARRPAPQPPQSKPIRAFWRRLCCSLRRCESIATCTTNAPASCIPQTRSPSTGSKIITLQLHSSSGYFGSLWPYLSPSGCLRS